MKDWKGKPRQIVTKALRSIHTEFVRKIQNFCPDCGILWDPTPEGAFRGPGLPLVVLLTCDLVHELLRRGLVLSLSYPLMSSLYSLVSDLFTRHLFFMNRRARKKQEHLVLQEPRLPMEILTTIINELASDTEDNYRALAALAACRLACYALCSLTTPLFFSSIHLTDSVGPMANDRKRLKGSKLLSKRAKKLNDILRIDDIANLVKTLTLRCDTLNLASRPNAVLISKILHHRLPHIQMFAFKADFVYEGVSLSCRMDMPKRFVSGIQALCKSPNLTTLHVHNVYHFPITAIIACPNLQRLRLWHAAPDVNLFFFLVHSQPLTLHSSSTA